MLLPNGDRAIIDPAKLVNYCLNVSHPTGKHKARVFKARLGITRLQAHLLQHSIAKAAATLEASRGDSDFYGQRFAVDFDMTGAAGTGRVRSAWIILRGEDCPRLTSCYVL